MGEHQPAAARQIRVGDLQVGVLRGDVVVPRQPAAQIAIALLVVDGGDAHGRVFRLVGDREQAEVAHQLGAEELQHEALVAVVRPGLAQRAERLAVAGDLREPLAVLLGRLRARCA